MTGRIHSRTKCRHASCFVLLLLAPSAWCAAVGQETDKGSTRSNEASTPIEGLWAGTWGGGERDGTVFQPVIAEMLVQGKRIEVHGFRKLGQASGTFHLDRDANRMTITPIAADGERFASLEFEFKIKGVQLTLTDADGVAVTLSKVPVARDPLAGARIELAVASGFDDAGNLLVTELTVLRVGNEKTELFSPAKRSIELQGATVAVLRESGWREIKRDEARQLVSDKSPVVLMRRDEYRPAAQQTHFLWREAGAPAPECEAVRRTLALVLRPGTLVFVLPPEQVPVP